MAIITWANPALDQLESIIQYIALDKPSAAKKLASDVLKAVGRLERFPNSGQTPPELGKGIYQEVICPPLRVVYRYARNEVLIVHVMREEQQLRKFLLNVKDE